MNMRIYGGSQGGHARVTPNGVESEGKVDFTGGTVSVGGNFTSTGKVTVYEGGRLEIQGNLISTGDIKINDPEKIKQIIIETLKTTSSITEFGTELLKKIGLSGSRSESK